MLCPAALASQARQTDRPGGQTDLQAQGAAFGLWANFQVPITSGKIRPSRGAKAKQGLIKMARDELFIKLFSHF